MLAGLCSATLSAAPIFGTFNIAGTITATGNTITWRLNDPPFPADQARIGPGSTGSFTGLDGTLITIADLNRVTEPVGAPFPAQPFISFLSGPTLPGLQINNIFNGIYPNTQCTAAPAVGQVCTPTPPNSPFNFVNNQPAPPTGPFATATFVFSGVTSDGLSSWQGNFTSQFTVPYQTLLAALAPGGAGFVTNTFSATFLVTPNAVPEPSPAILAACGLGLVLFSAGLRKKFNRC